MQAMHASASMMGSESSNSASLRGAGPCGIAREPQREHKGGMAQGGGYTEGKSTGRVQQHTRGIYRAISLFPLHLDASHNQPGAYLPRCAFSPGPPYGPLQLCGQLGLHGPTECQRGLSQSQDRAGQCQVKVGQRSRQDNARSRQDNTKIRAGEGQANDSKREQICRYAIGGP